MKHPPAPFRLPSDPTMTESLDLGALRHVINSLAEGLAVVEDAAWFSRQPQPVQNTLVAGVIQNFEFVYEVAVKMIKRRLEADAFTPTEVDASNFREVLRAAGEKGLVADVEAWFGYRTLRGTTSHAYDRGKAQQVFDAIPAFLHDARALLAALEARNG
jgi:nucleotidyltransferase substrate binding protein (TIGR01987 family)